MKILRKIKNWFYRVQICSNGRKRVRVLWFEFFGWTDEKVSTWMKAERELPEKQKELMEVSRKLSVTKDLLFKAQQNFSETQKAWSETQKEFAETQKNWANAQSQLDLARKALNEERHISAETSRLLAEQQSQVQQLQLSFARTLKALEDKEAELAKHQRKRLKCYLAVVAPDDETSVYIDLLEVALKSAKLNTTLDINVLYDGPKGHRCHNLLNKYDAHIIPHKFSHEKDIERLFNRDFEGRPMEPRKIVSAFMRLDIPFVEQEAEYVLYVDLDVLFTRDIRAEELPKPQYLAASSQFSQKQGAEANFNAGVLVMNVRNMRQRCELIFKDLEESVIVNGFDQGYLNKYCKADYTWLPVEYNWKPYWGINTQAAIIHYHGMKPGGSNESSGFGMSDQITRRIMHNENCLQGVAYYYMEFFHYLAPGDSNRLRWLAEYLNKAHHLSIPSQSPPSK